MELKGSKTEKNLMEAFAGESMARNKYTFFASVAKKAGYEQLAAIFEETAGNEKEHAKLWFKALNGGEMPDVMTCLELAAGGEHDEQVKQHIGGLGDQFGAVALHGLDDGLDGLFAEFLGAFLGAFGEKLGRPTAVGVRPFAGLNRGGEIVNFAHCSLIGIPAAAICALATPMV